MVLRVTMIYGDHQIAAAAIADVLAVSARNSKTEITSAEIEEMNHRRVAGERAGVDVFARASPQHKLAS